MTLTTICDLIFAGGVVLAALALAAAALHRVRTPVLLVVTVFWSSTFILNKGIVAEQSPLGYLTGVLMVIGGIAIFWFPVLASVALGLAAALGIGTGVVGDSQDQLMYGILGFLTLSIVLQQHWTLGVSYAAAMLAAAIMTSKRWSPGLAWKRWRIARARARLTVMSGGKGHAPPARDEHKWLN